MVLQGLTTVGSSKTKGTIHTQANTIRLRYKKKQQSLHILLEHKDYIRFGLDCEPLLHRKEFCSTKRSAWMDILGFSICVIPVPVSCTNHANKTLVEPEST